MSKSLFQICMRVGGLLHWVMCEEEVDFLVCKDNLNLRSKDMKRDQSTSTEMRNEGRLDTCIWQPSSLPL